jgi:hypothetical protein
MDDMGDLTPPSWLIKPLFESQSLVMLFGPANEGKTFIALSMALSVASGLDWAGHPVQQSPVVYVVGEGNRGIQKRAYAWRTHYGHSAPACKFISRPVQIADDEERHNFINTLRPFGPKLIVLDTLATMTLGIDENDTAAMGLFTHATREISNELGASVVIVHHPTKADPNSYRGSYQLEGNVDTMIRVRRAEPKNPLNRNIVLTNLKQKDEDRFAAVTVGALPVTLRAATEGQDAISSLVVIEVDEDVVDPHNPFSGLSASQTLVLTVLRELDMNTFTLEQIITAVDVKRNKPSKSSVTNNWLPALVRKGLVERMGDGIYRMPVLISSEGAALKKAA